MFKQMFASVLFGGLSALGTPNQQMQVETTPIYEQTNLRFEKYFFNDTDQTAYIIEDTKIKDRPEEVGIDQLELKKYDTVELKGTNDYTYWKIRVNGKEYYADQSAITTDEKKIQEMKEAEEKAKAEEAKKATKSQTWTGPVLSPSAGTVIGPNGKETYYNLPMDGVISVMRSLGNTDEYWIREDGVKMLGQYVMVAANLSVHPRGSIVESSLGTAIVCDTGGFAHANPNQLDIAAAW